MTDLKPCPFCGGDPERVELNDRENVGGSVICCKSCMASSPVHFDRKENLEDSWNRRSLGEPVAWRVTYGPNFVSLFVKTKEDADRTVDNVLKYVRGCTEARSEPLYVSQGDEA